MTMKLPVFSDWTISDTIDDFMEGLKKASFETVYDGKKTYYNVAAAFDIETTSFLSERSEKTAIMYAWTLAIGRQIVMGRTWEQLLTLCERIRRVLKLGKNRVLCIYVHNLPYEFGFISKLFEWDKVFAVDKRKPIYAISNGICFKCSYILSNLSLENVAKTLKYHRISKLTSELDYKKIRHTKTPLTEQERMYCYYDVIIVVYYIEEAISRNGSIYKIPLTNTGYVRRFCREACFNGIDGGEYWKEEQYRDFIGELILEPDEYLQLKRAFMGGFTHASCFAVGRVIDDVISYDFTSSYPAVMVAEKFPMSKSEKIEIKSKDEFMKNLRCYCCLFDVRFVGLRPRIKYEHYLSRSRCWAVKGDVCDNGRIVSADEASTTLTEQDYMIVRAMYEWDYADIYNFRRYKKGYLPTDFVKAILKLYQDKTTLKGVEGAEDIYLMSKGMLNSTYGMAVTDIVRTEYVYKVGWEEKKPDLKTEIAKYNKAKRRFLFFPWGVWVTCFARRNIFSAIIDIGFTSENGVCDYLYADTDSVKITHADKHREYFEKYNTIITEKIKRALEYHKIPFEAAEPKTQEGALKMLGLWDFDGKYKLFKTLGAKRYLTQDYDGHYKMTVAGLGKQAGIDYLLRTYGDNVFNAFTDGMYVPAGNTGKMTHTYIDTVRKGVITDYLGEKAEYLELSGVHLEEASYELSMSKEFSDYLRGLWK